MKILVTGGAGFIGTNLCLALRERGNEVIALDNLSITDKNLPDLEAAGVVFVRADIIDLETMRPYFEGVDAVVHLAAMNRAQRSIEHPLEANAVNITGTLNVLESMRAHAVPKIIFASSSSVYAGREGALAEDDRLAPPHPYGVGKLASEHYLNVYGQIFGLSWITLRFFSIYGPRQQGDIDKAGVVAKFIHYAHTDQPLTIYGDGSSLRNFTYVDDVVRCILLALDTQSVQNTVLNVANSQEVSVGELAEKIAVISGAEPHISYEPPLKGDPARNFPNTDKCKEILGYEAEVSVDDGLARTIEWYRATRGLQT